MAGCMNERPDMAAIRKWLDSPLPEQPDSGELLKAGRFLQQVVNYVESLERITLQHRIAELLAERRNSGERYWDIAGEVVDVALAVDRHLAEHPIGEG